MAFVAASPTRRASIAVIVARRTSVTPARVAVESMSGLARFAPGASGGPNSRITRLRRSICFFERRLVDRVDLRQRDNFGFLGKALAVSREFTADGAIVGAGIGARRVHEMDERAAALDMAQEPVAEAVALMRALDQAGYVGEHEVAPVDPDDAETGMEGGEWIVRDFGLGGGDGGEEGRFAGVRQTDETCVGDQLESQKKRALDARRDRDWRGAASGWSRW